MYEYLINFLCVFLYPVFCLRYTLLTTAFLILCYFELRRYCNRFEKDKIVVIGEASYIFKIMFTHDKAQEQHEVVGYRIRRTVYADMGVR